MTKRPTYSRFLSTAALLTRRRRAASLIHGHKPRYRRAWAVCAFLQQVLGPSYELVLQERGVISRCTLRKWLMGSTNPHMPLLCKIEDYASTMGFQPEYRRKTKAKKVPARTTVEVVDPRRATMEVLQSLFGQQDTQDVPTSHSTEGLENMKFHSINESQVQMTPLGSVILGVPTVQNPDDSTSVSSSGIKDLKIS